MFTLQASTIEEPAGFEAWNKKIFVFLPFAGSTQSWVWDETMYCSMKIQKSEVGTSCYWHCYTKFEDTNLCQNQILSTAVKLKLLVNATPIL